MRCVCRYELQCRPIQSYTRKIGTTLLTDKPAWNECEASSVCPNLLGLPLKSLINPHTKGDLRDKENSGWADLL